MFFGKIGKIPHREQCGWDWSFFSEKQVFKVTLVRQRCVSWCGSLRNDLWSLLLQSHCWKKSIPRSLLPSMVTIRHLEVCRFSMFLALGRTIQELQTCKWKIGGGESIIYTLKRKFKKFHKRRTLQAGQRSLIPSPLTTATNTFMLTQYDRFWKLHGPFSIFWGNKVDCPKVTISLRNPLRNFGKIVVFSKFQ